ncbi:mucin-5AC-like isoform X2 [Trichoplusia ni]|nr:mucin-5AC-like isoform X2 [Trichoplusia ni]
MPPGCLYEGRWFSDGALVTTREECLRCLCVHNALTCRRRACAPLPDPMPRRCHVRHRRGSCCPEMHCPDGVTYTEHGAVARFENEEAADVSTPSSLSHACVEGGTVYAAGSAMGSSTACEQCFCLQGARRCVRPSCLPPPPHCAPRPAAGACCPQRYYCDRSDEQHLSHEFDCLVDGQWVKEGASVPSGGNCSACFCLHGSVRCQAMSCAPALSGCRPLLALGDCCAHQYICDHNKHKHPSSQVIENSMVSTKYDNRALHLSKSSKIESTTQTITGIYTVKDTPTATATKNHLITTTKVKRKTSEPPARLSPNTEQNTNRTSSTGNLTTTVDPVTSGKLVETTSEVTSDNTTEQPEGTVKIVINGTINCTAELSSTSLPLSIPLNDTERIQMEAMPRVPIVNIEAQTYSPNDIITDRSVNGGFDENDTFTINVTSSLMTNTSHSTTRPVMTVSKIPAPSDSVDTFNSSKKTKGDYDYDYTEPTLPPSLPNLKIIPFVAADAVVDDEPTKDAITYPILEREDKFPVYYPSGDSKEPYPTRREDIYNPTQYPVFISEKVEPSYPTITQDVDLTSHRYPVQSDLGVHEYTVSTSLGSHLSEAKAVTNVPTTSSTFELETPSVNLFSPPVETEGGFVPKGPGILDEYFTVYASTPPAASVPHLTTSMQLDITKDSCTTEDQRSVAEGDSVEIRCSTCTCQWGELRCRPSQDPACLIDKNTNTSKKEEKVNETKVVQKNESSPVTLDFTGADVAGNKDMVTTEKAIVKDVNEKIASTKVSSTQTESVPTTTLAPSTTPKPVVKVTTTTTTPTPIKEVNDTSQEYDDDDDDEGFSLGSMLKLLLSDTYESTTAAPTKKITNAPSSKPTPVITSTRRPPSVAPFIPLPPQPYIPQKAPNMVNRIDHLVLGEATAIKRTTPRPITNKTTKRPVPKTTTERQPEIKEVSDSFKPVAHEGPRPPNLGGLPGVGAGLLKLAGCNIYGRMYRVGRIIAELSTPCQECWCTELGVQCKPLGC